MHCWLTSISMGDGDDGIAYSTRRFLALGVSVLRAEGGAEAATPEFALELLLEDDSVKHAFMVQCWHLQGTSLALSSDSLSARTKVLMASS